jgi:hypothetical protein
MPFLVWWYYYFILGNYRFRKYIIVTFRY